MSSEKSSPSPPPEVVDKGETQSSPSKSAGKDATGRLKRVREGSLEPNAAEASVPVAIVTKKNRVASSSSGIRGLNDDSEAADGGDVAESTDADEVSTQIEGKTVGEVRKKVEKMNWKEGQPDLKEAVVEEAEIKGSRPDIANVSDGQGVDEAVTKDIKGSSAEDVPPAETPAGDRSWEKIDKDEAETGSGEGLKRKALERSGSSYTQLDADSSAKRQKDTPSPVPDHAQPVSAPSKKPQSTFASFASSSSPFASLKSPSPALEATEESPALPPPVKKPQATFGAFASTSSPFASVKSASTGPSSSEPEQKTDPAPTKKPQATFGSFSSSASPFSAAPKTTSAFASAPTKGSAFGTYSATSSAFMTKKTTPVDGEEKGEVGPSSFGDILKDAGGEEFIEKKVEMHEQDVTTGEEDEETVYQTRAKLYVSDKEAGWKERGVGILKLNVRRGDGLGARLVMRADGVFRLLLNSKLYKGLNPLVDGKVVRMNLPHEGNFTLVSLRVGNPKVSEELADCIHEHIPLDGASASKSPEPIGA
ncbi:hypothetical protein IAR55_005490 [Kwoniella newhampshirensis]|uniref:RanBD1 domain-containing protein n=1 Tax=Kwoniella newhampshirensis TaxID=1651941 RepID=A0AAW0YL04_9TREE